MEICAKINSSAKKIPNFDAKNKASFFKSHLSKDEDEMIKSFPTVDINISQFNFVKCLIAIHAFQILFSNSQTVTDVFI